MGGGALDGLDQGVTVAETARRLDRFGALLWKCVLVEAAWASRLADTHVKILMGSHVHHDVRSIDGVRRRLAEVALVSSGVVESAVGDASDPLVRALVALGDADDPVVALHGMYRVVKPALRAAMDDHRVETHRIWDEPSTVLLHAAVSDLDEQCTEAAPLLSRLLAESGLGPDDAAARWEEAVAAVADDAGFTTPVIGYPARDECFEIVSDTAPGSADAPDATRHLTHFVLTQVEILTIEHCARVIVEFPEMPWDFVLDMARQCWDEARHARLFHQRLVQLGGELGDYPIDMQLYEMTAGLPLAMRLAVHQRIGEWLGVDDAILLSQRFGESGDVLTQRMFQFIAADEVNHVAFGNKWLRALAGSEEAVREVHEKALAHRLQFGETVNGRPGMPLHRAACRLSGFSAEEVEYLADNRVVIEDDAIHARLGA